MNFFRRLYQFDYMGHKKWWFTFSGVISSAHQPVRQGRRQPVNGLNYGLEFQEGTRITVAFETPPPLAEVRDGGERGRLPERADPADRQRRRAARPRASRSRRRCSRAEQQAELQAALDEKFTIAELGRQAGLEPRDGERLVRPAGRELVAQGDRASRCCSSSSTSRSASSGSTPSGRIAAEIHDLLIVVGVYSLTGREVTTATIAAVLTILGYSLYDTVIIYDRIRENEPKLSRMAYGDMVNESLWETLTRSINTSFMSLLPVICLLLFGGETLKDFAFALLRRHPPRRVLHLSSSRARCSRCSRSASRVQEAQGAGHAPTGPDAPRPDPPVAAHAAST